MSDPTGQDSTPSASTFSSPEGYASTSLAVKSLGGSSYEPVFQNAPSVQKGETAGTFKPRYKQPTESAIFFGKPPKVGGEVRNPETEKLVAHAKAALEAGIEPVYDNAGKIVSVTIPEGFVHEDEVKEKLDALEALKNGDMKILQELIPVQAEYLSLKNSSVALQSKLQNPSTLATLEQVAQEAEVLVEEIKEKPLYVKLDELKAKLEELKIALERAKQEIAKIPVPPPVSVSPATAVSASPAQAPKPVELPRAFDIFSAWTFQSIADQSKRKEFKAVFDEYFAFMKEVDRAKMLASFISLIEEKWGVADAINNKDMKLAQTLLERMKTELAEKKSDLQKMLDEETKRKNIEELKERLKATRKNLKENLKGGLLVQNEQRVEELKTWGVSDDVVKFYERELEKIKSARSKLESALDATDETVTSEQLLSLNAQFEGLLDGLAQKLTLELTKQEKLNSFGNAVTRGPVLRPIVATSIGSEKKIYLKGKRELSVGQLAVELENEKRLKTHEKELEQARGWAETRKLYEEAFARDKDTFIKLYTDERADPASGESVYTKKKNLLENPYKKIIEDILSDAGITLFEATSAETIMDEKRKKGSESSSLRNHREVYSPVNDPYAGKTRPNDPKTPEEKLAYPQQSQYASQEDGKAVDESKPKMILDEGSTEWQGMVKPGGPQPEMARINGSSPEEIQPIASPESKKTKALQRVGKLMSSLNGDRKLTWEAVVAATVIGLTGAAAYVAQQPGRVFQDEAAIATPKQNADKITWRKYFHEAKINEKFAHFADDLSTTPLKDVGEKILKKYVTSYDHSKINIAKGWFVKYILDDVPDESGTVDENKYRLSDEARTEMSKLVKVLEDVSMATSGEKPKSTRLGDMIEEVAKKVSQREL